jgi:hypothetical protein
MLASAVLAAAAMPAFGQTTIFVETAPSYPAYVPPTTYYYYTEPPIVVTPRDDDASINQGVVDTLASDPNLSGRIGVETRDREVNLSGIVTTEGQSMRAERDAKSVYGVSNVQNDLTTRIGPHTH